VPAHATFLDAKTHLELTHGFEVAPGTTEADAVTTHDALGDHYHRPDGNPVFVPAAGGIMLPAGAPDEMRPIARLTSPAERVAEWRKLTDRYNTLIAMAARMRRNDVGAVFQQTVADGYRTKGTPGSWPEVDRRLGLNPGRAYRIWHGND
jgi:hypothetical protein